MATRPVWNILAVVSIGLMIILGGLGASLGSPVVTLVIAALVVAPGFLAAPVSVLWLAIAGGLVISGLTTSYLPAFQQVRWGIALGATALVAIAPILGFFTKDRDAGRQHLSGVSLFCLLFFLVVVLSTLLNRGASFDAIAGLKNYFQVWGILVAFALFPLQRLPREQFMTALLWIAFLQLPFALHQFLILVPKRTGLLDAALGIVPSDIVAGTFSGSMSGGGAGPAMVTLQAVALAILLATWRAKRLTTIRTVLGALFLLIPGAIGEVKIMLVLFPVVVAIVYQDQLLHNPLRAVTFSLASMLVLSALFFTYTLLPRAGGQRALTVDEFWAQTLSYNVGDRGYGNSVLNRSSVYPFWLKYHQNGGGIVSTIVGHGAGQARETRSGLSEHSLATNRYPGYGIGLTGFSALLWETGILGTVAVLGILVAGYRTAKQLQRLVPFGSPQWTRLIGVQGGMAAIGVSLLHNNMFQFEIGYQTLFVILLGYLLHLRRELGHG